MQINPLPRNIEHLFNVEPVRTAVSQFSGQDNNFSDIFTETLANASATDAIDKASGLELLFGESDDLSGLILDAQKAELALQLTLQIRNKIVDAYNEVMRMTV